MNYKNLIISLAIISQASATELDFGLSEEDNKLITARIIDEIKNETKNLKNAGNKYMQYGISDAKDIEGEKYEDVKAKFRLPGNMVRTYEESKRRDAKEREVTEMKKDIEEQIKQLETDIYHVNTLRVHTEERN